MNIRVGASLLQNSGARTLWQQIAMHVQWLSS
jgi:hypothetical protein